MAVNQYNVMESFVTLVQHLDGPDYSMQYVQILLSCENQPYGQQQTITLKCFAFYFSMICQLGLQYEWYVLASEDVTDFLLFIYVYTVTLKHYIELDSWKKDVNRLLHSACFLDVSW